MFSVALNRKQTVGVRNQQKVTRVCDVTQLAVQLNTRFSTLSAQSNFELRGVWQAC